MSDETAPPAASDSCSPSDTPAPVHAHIAPARAAKIAALHGVLQTDYERARLARAMKIAALLVFLAAGYVRNQRPGWNVNSQISLVYALVERGTFSIDAYHDDPATATGDKAFHGGRFYCDKSPVTSFLGVPVYWAARETVRALAGGYGHALERDRGWARYVTTWGTIGGCAAGLAALLTLALARAGVPPERAGMLAALWFAATPLLGYSILFFNYVPACAMALGGVLLAQDSRFAERARRRASAWEILVGEPARWRILTGEIAAWRLVAGGLVAGPLIVLVATSSSLLTPVALILSAAVLVHRACPSAGRLFLGGFLMGLAAWTLQTLALLALILTVAMLVERARAILRMEPTTEDPTEGPTEGPQRGRALPVILRSWLGLLPWAIGGVLGASGYAIYSLAIFGRVASPYEFEFDPHFREGMAQGLMGAGIPRLDVMFLILVHPFRGLFTLFPGTLLAFVGACLVLARRGAPPDPSPDSSPPSSRHSSCTETAVGLAFFAGLTLYNAGYYMWWGGWAYAPRHLIPALPLLALGFAPFARPGNRTAFRATVALLALGALVNLAVVSLDPQPPPGLPESMLLEPEGFLRWRSPFFEVLGYVWRGQTDPNWGTALGLRGVWSLAPLVAIWAAGLGFLSTSSAPFRTPAPVDFDPARVPKGP